MRIKNPLVILLLFVFFLGLILFLILSNFANIPSSLKNIAYSSELTILSWIAFLFITKNQNPKMLIGFFATIIMVNIISLFIITILNFFSCKFTNSSLFLVFHLITYFINLIITVPMFIFGIEEEK